ncbi:MAG: hypothetical protein HQL37_04195 [Alphaproteobacteria bacterium]|nr:hypothetical protein [Alphaproteobacteria bacterium]
MKAKNVSSWENPPNTLLFLAASYGVKNAGSINSLHINQELLREAPSYIAIYAPPCQWLVIDADSIDRGLDAIIAVFIGAAIREIR